MLTGSFLPTVYIIMAGKINDGANGGVYISGIAATVSILYVTFCLQWKVAATTNLLGEPFLQRVYWWRYAIFHIRYYALRNMPYCLVYADRTTATV